MPDSIYSYTPDLTRPYCAKCGCAVEQRTDTPEIPWIGTCELGHSFTYQLENEEQEQEISD